AIHFLRCPSSWLHARLSSPTFESRSLNAKPSGSGISTRGSFSFLFWRGFGGAFDLPPTPVGLPVPSVGSGGVLPVGGGDGGVPPIGGGDGGVPPIGGGEGGVPPIGGGEGGVPPIGGGGGGCVPPIGGGGGGGCVPPI